MPRGGACMCDEIAARYHQVCDSATQLCVRAALVFSLVGPGVTEKPVTPTISDRALELTRTLSTVNLPPSDVRRLARGEIEL